MTINLINMKSRLFLFLCMGLMLGFVACNNDDDDDVTPTPTNTTGATMTIVMNGTTYTGSGFNNTLLGATDQGKYGWRMDIRGNFNSGKQLILSVSNWDFQNPPTNGIIVKTYDTDILGPNTVYIEEGGYTYADGALGTYMVSTSDFQMTTSDQHGYIRISSCDPSAKKVSGDFSFITLSMSDSDTTTFSGSFSNQSYSVYAGS